jgi:zinc/manganese transport system permease protein
MQAFALACGFLFVSLYQGYLNGINALLFGSFLGITHSQVVTLAVVGAITLVLLAAVGRPLLFASLDSQVAGARGVPVRGLSIVFLLLLGAAVAEASQITGALLVFALLVAPAATAQVMTPRPALGLLISPLIGLAITWAGLGLAYWWPYPIGFIITTLAFAAYVAARLGQAWAEHRSTGRGREIRA